VAVTCTHGYVAIKPCGCIVSCVVDDPAHVKEVARFVALDIRRGYRVERMEIEAIRPLIRRCRCGRVGP